MQAFPDVSPGWRARELDRPARRATFRRMPFAPFVPLRVLSSYSMLEGAIDPKGIAKLAKERGYPAIAIADRNGLYGSVAFAAACRDNGVQPVIGTTLAVARPAEWDGQGGAIDWLALYAQNETGWNNLCHLVSRAHLDRPDALGSCAADVHHQ